MNHIEELHHIVELRHKHNLPLSPILEYVIKEREEECVTEEKGMSIALDKGDITARAVVDKLIDKMEQYANFGFDYIQEKLEQDSNYFFKETAFLNVFTSFLIEENDVDDDNEPEDLD